MHFQMGGKAYTAVANIFRKKCQIDESVRQGMLLSIQKCMYIFLMPEQKRAGLRRSAFGLFGI